MLRQGLRQGAFSKALAQFLVSAFLAIDARNLLDPADPPSVGMLYNRRVFHILSSYRLWRGTPTTTFLIMPLNASSTLASKSDWISYTSVNSANAQRP